MSRTTASDTSSTSRSHAFPFRSRTAPDPASPESSSLPTTTNHNNSSSNNRHPRTPKPRKLNSLFRFNKDESGDYNQSRQPSTPTVQGNRRAQSNASVNEDEDEDDYSDSGTVQPGQGRYTLRVINPDPVSSSDEEEEDEEEQEKSDTTVPPSSTQNHHVVTQQQALLPAPGQQPVEQRLENGGVVATSATLLPPPPPPVQDDDPSSIKLEISQPLPPLPPQPQHDRHDKAKSPMQFVTSFLSTAPSPTASSLSLNSSNRGGTEGGRESSINESKSQTELVRRQSKTLHEQGKVELLPPLDLHPMDWTIPSVETQPKPYPRVVLGPAPVAEEDNEEEEEFNSNNNNNNNNNNNSKVVLEDSGLLVASPATLTPQATPIESESRRQSGTSAHKFMPPLPQPFFAAANNDRTFGLAHLPESARKQLSPSIGDSGILPSSMYGNRSIATTANESVLTSTMTRAPQSKYSKASYSLTNSREALKLYREMAEKTNSKEVQLSYANYLLEIAQLYDTKHNGQQQQQPQQQQQQKGHHRGAASLSLNMNRRQSRDSSISIDGRLNDMMKRGRASLNGPIRNIRPIFSLESDNSMDNKEKKRTLEEEGVRWIKRLAKEDVGEAAYMLATWIDEEKYGCRSNPIKSFKLYEVAARSGKAEAMFAVAQYYERDGNHTEALANYKTAAEKGLVAAVHRLAQVHLHGELSQRQNMITGLAVLAQAAENANESYPEPICVFAQVLANIYPRADIPAELVQPYGGANAAKEWFERGAEFGHAKCHSHLGNLYEHGLFGAPVDMRKSFRYYEFAAQHDDPEGMLGLSRLYNADRHGPDDTENRAEHDVSQWLAELGRNEDASFHWCSKAAEHGLDEALFLLGYYNEIGFGTPRDYNRAQTYYRRAAAKGHHGASERLQSNSFTSRQHESAVGTSHRGLQEGRKEQACLIM